MKRARGQEVIRQWKLLKETEAASYGLTVEQLAERLGVTSRTIRRDLSQLQEAGFPLEQRQRDARRAWSLNREAFKGLMDSGLTLAELCALYFSRALMEFLAGTPFRQDLASAFEKFEQCLTPAQLKYLEDFPKVLAARPEPRKKRRRRRAVTRGPAHDCRPRTSPRVDDVSLVPQPEGQELRDRAVPDLLRARRPVRLRRRAGLRRSPPVRDRAHQDASARPTSASCRTRRWTWRAMPTRSACIWVASPRR